MLNVHPFWSIGVSIALAEGLFPPPAGLNPSPAGLHSVAPSFSESASSDSERVGDHVPHQPSASSPQSHPAPWLGKIGLSIAAILFTAGAPSTPTTSSITTLSAPPTRSFSSPLSSSLLSSPLPSSSQLPAPSRHPSPAPSPPVPPSFGHGRSPHSFSAQPSCSRRCNGTGAPSHGPSPPT